MKKEILLISLIIFFSYELIAIKFNFYSISLYILSILTLKPNYNQLEQYDKIIRNIIYSNPLYNSKILKYLYSVDIVGISEVISFSEEFFYINSVPNLKTLDIVLNDQNFLGIVEKVSSKISRVKYIKSNSFQIPAKVIQNNKNIFGFIKSSSQIYFYPLSKTQIQIYSEVQTMGYFHIPSGIIIGIIYNNNEIKLYKTVEETEQVIIIRKVH